MKVCSLYGAGFYYIPGTDICMKIGGYVRFQQSFGSATSVTSGPISASSSNNREHNLDQQHRVRAIATFDTRQQTAYGTLRTYLLLGYTNDSVSVGGTDARDALSNQLYSTRAFIQLAGFTFGKATSFFDFVSTAAVAYNAGHTFSPDTGDGGHIVAAYTAQFGNGLSATISAESDRRRGIDYLGGAGGTPVLAADQGGSQLGQNFVGNIRVDQAWGSAQVSAAVRNTSASYYNATVAAGLVDWNGHPDDKWGFAVSGGLRLNAPMIGPGDYFQAGIVYAEGATKYASNTPSTVLNGQGDTYGFAVHNDGGFTGSAAAPGIYELTTAWSVFASFEHFWTPSLRTSVYGSYVNLSRPDGLNDAMCASGLYGSVTAGMALSRAAGCDLDSAQWNIGTRTQWNITKDLYVGVDVIYGKIESGKVNNAGSATFAATTGKAAGDYNVGDQDAWAATWRIHRDIVP